MATINKKELVHGGRMEVWKLPLSGSGFAASGDVSDPIDLALYSEISIHALGTFAGAIAIAAEGSNEFDVPAPASFIPLRDSNETVISFVAADLVVVLESPVWIRFRATAGSGGANVSIYVKGLRRAN